MVKCEGDSTKAFCIELSFVSVCLCVCVCEINSDIDQNTEEKPVSPEAVSIIYSRASIYIPKTETKARMGPMEFPRIWPLFSDVQTTWLELQVP